MIPATTAMRDYAAGKTGSLLDEVVFAMHNAARLPDESAVHKMRVAIRRFQQAIRLFAQYLKSSGMERVKGEMRAIMQIAGELRNRDIAIGLVTEAGGDITDLTEQRLAYKHQLAELLKRHAKPDLSLLWREELGLGTTV